MWSKCIDHLIRKLGSSHRMRLAEHQNNYTICIRPCKQRTTSHNQHRRPSAGRPIRCEYSHARSLRDAAACSLRPTAAESAAEVAALCRWVASGVRAGLVAGRVPLRDPICAETQTRGALIYQQQVPSEGVVLEHRSIKTKTGTVSPCIVAM